MSPSSHWNTHPKVNNQFISKMNQFGFFLFLAFHMKYDSMLYMKTVGKVTHLLSLNLKWCLLETETLLSKEPLFVCCIQWSAWCWDKNWHRRKKKNT